MNWTTIYSTTTGLGGVQDLTGLSGTGRYVRMYGTVRGLPAYGYSLYELEVFGTPVPTNQPPVLAAIPANPFWPADAAGHQFSQRSQSSSPAFDLQFAQSTSRCIHRPKQRRVHLATNHYAIALHTDSHCGGLGQRGATSHCHPKLHGNSDSTGHSYSQCVHYQRSIRVFDHRRYGTGLHDSGFHQPDFVESSDHQQCAVIALLLG